MHISQRRLHNTDCVMNEHMEWQFMIDCGSPGTERRDDAERGSVAVH